MDRVILHCDCNNYFASVELLDKPELRDCLLYTSDAADEL